MAAKPPGPGEDETALDEKSTPKPAAETVLSAEPLPDLPSRFKVHAPVGQGGMGRVYRAHDRNLGRDVALKILPPELRASPEMRERFLREARAAAQLKHPGIVAVHDLDPEGVFIVMELVDGETLAARQKREGKLPPAEVRRIGAALLDALAAAHSAGVIHRDVKPANVIVDPQGGVHLVDFGIASFGESDLTAPGSWVGTPSYMAPEQLRGQQVTARSDLYAVGATLFELATGARLHRDAGSSADPEKEVLAATGDAALAAALASALRERPDERYASAPFFARALAETRLPSRLPRAAWLAIAAVATVAVAVVTYAALRPPRRAAAFPPGGVALLPFEDRTGDSRLDFAAAGLPRLLGTQLKPVPGLQVIGYYRLLEDLGRPDVPRERWIEAARALGAGRLVRGMLGGAGGQVKVEVIVETIDGAELGRLSRTAPLEKVPAEIAALTPKLAVLLGVEAPVSSSRGASFGGERHLQLGLDALEAQQFDVARAHFVDAQRFDATAAEPSYYLALISWWTDAPEANTLSTIEGALSQNLAPAQREFLEGLRFLVRLEHDRAAQLFRAAATAHPDDRDNLYGLAEALYHGGHPGEGIAAWRRLGELSPRFGLGLFHVMDFYCSRGDEEGLRWVLGRRAIKDDPDHQVWRATARLCLRDYPGAETLARELLAAEPPGPRSLHAAEAEVQLGRALLLQGRLAEAGAVFDALSPQKRGDTRLAELGLATLRGDERRREALLAPLRTEAGELPNDWSRLNAYVELLLLELPDAPPARLATIRDGIEVGWTPRLDHSPSPQVVRAFLAGRLGDGPALERARASGYPESVAVAEAFLAGSRHDPAAEAAAWGRALDAGSDGRFATVESFFRARALREAGDRSGAAAACADVAAPRVFRWSFATAAPRCLLWIAEAERVLGRIPQAKRALDRLDLLLAGAPASDPRRAAAREERGRL